MKVGKMTNSNILQSVIYIMHCFKVASFGNQEKTEQPNPGLFRAKSSLEPLQGKDIFVPMFNRTHETTFGAYLD